MNGRTCTKCDEWKEASCFASDRRYEGSLKSQCYDCVNERRRAKFANLSEEEKEVERAKQREWRNNNLEAANERDRKRRLPKIYGITNERYDEILEAQGNRCAVCGSDDPGHYGKFVVDHDHETDAVRGLLCDDCNKGLGNFKDSIFNLESAIAYLNAKNDWRF